jgi:response regulator of citrate/malate metabolism
LTKSARLTSIKAEALKLAESIQAFEEEQNKLIPMREFGQYFAQVLKNRKITIQEASNLTGLSDKTLSKVIQNPESIESVKYGTINKMAKMIGATVCLNI